MGGACFHNIILSFLPSCETFYNANGKCEVLPESKYFRSYIFDGLEEPTIDRRKETKKLNDAIKFLKTYTKNEKYPDEDDNFSTEYWTGGQVTKSVEDQTRVWTWRTSQTKADLGLFSQKISKSLKPQENHCLSVNFQKKELVNKNEASAEVIDDWKASPCSEDKKFICELPGISIVFF